MPLLKSLGTNLASSPALLSTTWPLGLTGGTGCGSGSVEIFLTGVQAAARRRAVACRRMTMDEVSVAPGLRAVCRPSFLKCR